MGEEPHNPDSGNDRDDMCGFYDGLKEEPHAKQWNPSSWHLDFE